VRPCVAADYDGAVALQHWIHHYSDLGVKPENFLVVVNSNKVGWCRLNPVESRVESAWFQRLKLRYDESPSNFAFNLNLRRYNEGERTKEVDECTRILDEKGIGYVLWLTQYSSEVMYKHRMELMSKAGGLLRTSTRPTSSLSSSSSSSPSSSSSSSTTTSSSSSSSSARRYEHSP